MQIWKNSFMVESSEYGITQPFQMYLTNLILHAWDGNTVTELTPDAPETVSVWQFGGRSFAA
jgi:hypothetical protein